MRWLLQGFLRTFHLIWLFILHSEIYCIQALIEWLYKAHITITLDKTRRAWRLQDLGESIRLQNQTDKALQSKVGGNKIIITVFDVIRSIRPDPHIFQYYSSYNNWYLLAYMPLKGKSVLLLSIQANKQHCNHLYWSWSSKTLSWSIQWKFKPFIKNFLGDDL